METMRAEIAAQPPVEGAYSARRGDYCIAKFADGEWYVEALKRYKLLFSESEHQSRFMHLLRELVKC